MKNPMTQPVKASLEPIVGAARAGRRRLSWRGELGLALLPTATVLVVLAFVHVLSNQQLLFASLASSAFLIYLDPQHGTNRVRTLVASQMTAAGLGFVLYEVIGPGYVAGGLAMVGTIMAMVLFDFLHPPAVSTSLAFALRAGDEKNIVLFLAAVAMIAMLVVLQRAAVWMVVRWTKNE